VAKANRHGGDRGARPIDTTIEIFEGFAVATGDLVVCMRAVVRWRVICALQAYWDATLG